MYRLASKHIFECIVWLAFVNVLPCVLKTNTCRWEDKQPDAFDHGIITCSLAEGLVMISCLPSSERNNQKIDGHGTGMH